MAPIATSWRRRSLESELNTSELLFSLPGSRVASFQDAQSPLACYVWWANQHLKSCKDIYRRISPDPLPDGVLLEKLLQIWKVIALELKGDDDTSLGTILDKVIQEDLLKPIGIPEKQVALHLIHAMIGIQAMLYIPGELDDPPMELCIKNDMDDFEGQAIIETRQDFSFVGERLYHYLMRFGVMLPAPKYDLLEKEAEKEFTSQARSEINPYIMNASNLATTGRINFRWTDSLACHLELNVEDRELFVFRYPTYCIYARTSQPIDEMSRGAIHGCAKHSRESFHWATPSDVSQLLKETVLSYRLLFGQNRASRRFYKNELDPWSNVPLVGRDAMLETLCTEKKFDAGLGYSEKDIYTIKTDFPMLYGKLVRLQMFLDSTRPQTIRELWKDRRDNSSWVTLWVVVIIGSLGLLLALMQVVLQIVQIALQS